MPYVYNATNEPQSTKVFGNYFSFAPKQMRFIHQPNVAAFISEERREEGLVVLPAEFDDPEYKLTVEGKAKLAEAEKEGIKNFVAKLRFIIYNNQVSLKQDLDKANLKVDPSIFASEASGPGGQTALDAMRLLAKYQRDENDQEQRQTDEVKELMRKIGPLNK